jgi:capsular polysaccharide biosynthesis protein
MMGIPFEKLVFMGKYTHLQADSLVIPSVNRQEITSENAQYLYDKLALSSKNQGESNTPQKIYIARRRRHWRNVINETELLAKLRPLGFKHFYLEDMPIQEQVRLFHNARFVVGPHGSGLVNLVYCKTGTRVVEIATPVRPSGLFRIIAHDRGLKYVNYVGSASQIRCDESNIQCDVDGLIQLILEMEKCSELA